MNNSNKNIITLIKAIISVILFSFLGVEIYRLSTINDKILKETRKEEFQGIILDRYLDSTSHMARTVTIRVGEDTISESLSLWGESWRCVRIGDTIMKKRDTLALRIRKDSTILLFFHDDLNLSPLPVTIVR